MQHMYTMYICAISCTMSCMICTLKVNWKQYKKALWRVLFNNTVVAIVCNLITYSLIRWRGNSCGYELPYFSTTVVHFFGFLIVEEIGFYYTHRYV